MPDQSEDVQDELPREVQIAMRPSPTHDVQAQPPWFTEKNAIDLPADYDWTPQEHWAWARIIRGMVANLNRYPGERTEGQSFVDWLNGKDDRGGTQASELVDVDWQAERAALQKRLSELGSDDAEQRAELTAEIEAATVGLNAAEALKAAKGELEGAIAADDGQRQSDIGARISDLERAARRLKPWPEHRTLSDTFMRLILFQSAYRDARSRPWVRISRAVFTEELIWENESCRGELGLYNCRFLGEINWLGLRVETLLNLGGSRFEQEVGADGLWVRGALFCRNGFVALRDIRLLGATIGADCTLSGSLVGGGLHADRLSVQGNMFFDDGFRALGAVRLLGAHVHGTLSFDGARLEGGVQADGVNISRTLFLRNAGQIREASLNAAHVGHDLQLSDSVIMGAIDLTNAIIGGELQTGQRKGSTPTWGDNSRLILRNATVGALAGGVDTFPKQAKGKPPPMELAGLSYQRLGGMGAGQAEAGSLAEASEKQLIRWLEAGHGKKQFTPAPYRRLAQALIEGGHTEKANKILHAMRKHERRCEEGRFRKLRMWASGFAIGFGYRNDYAVRWFGLLVVGFAALGLYWQGFRVNDLNSESVGEALRWLGFSFGNSIPLVTLDKAHETFLAAHFADPSACLAAAKAAAEVTGDTCLPDKLVQLVPVRIAWAFYVQKVLGFVILSFLAAGLTGAATRQKS